MRVGIVRIKFERLLCLIAWNGAMLPASGRAACVSPSRAVANSDPRTGRSGHGSTESTEVEEFTGLRKILRSPPRDANSFFDKISQGTQIGWRFAQHPTLFGGLATAGRMAPVTASVIPS